MGEKCFFVDENLKCPHCKKKIGEKALRKADHELNRKMEKEAREMKKIPILKEMREKIGCYSIELPLTKKEYEEIKDFCEKKFGIFRSRKLRSYKPKKYVRYDI